MLSDAETTQKIEASRYFPILGQEVENNQDIEAESNLLLLKLKKKLKDLLILFFGTDITINFFTLYQITKWYIVPRKESAYSS